MMRSEDLAPLLAAQPAPGVGFRKGVIVSWNPLTAENVVRVGGTEMANLPIVASNFEVAQIQPGDAVGIQVVGNGAAATMYIIGRITLPGTPGAASALGLTARGATVAASQNTTSTTYVNLATTGPAVTVTIGASARVQIILSAVATAFNDITVGGLLGGAMGFDASGANTATAADSQALFFGIELAANKGSDFGASRLVLLEGLNPGSTTFTAKYRNRGLSCNFRDRHIFVMPL